MTSVHDSRAVFASTNEHNAALRGARSAFPIGIRQQPSTNALNDAHGKSTFNNRGAAAAASIAERRRVKPTNGPQAIVTSANYAALQAHNRSQESLLPSTSASTKLSPQAGLGTFPPGSARATSPSNVAAALAAARSAPSNTPTSKPLPRHVRKINQPPSQRPSATVPNERDQKEMPVTGRVEDVRRWLDTLIDGNVINEDVKTDAADLSTSRIVYEHAAPPDNVLPDTLPRSKAPATSEAEAPTQAQNSVPRILSPIPVRVASTSTSVESSILGDLAGLQSQRQKKLFRKANALQKSYQDGSELAKPEESDSKLGHKLPSRPAECSSAPVLHSTSLRSSAVLLSGPQSPTSADVVPDVKPRQTLPTSDNRTPRGLEDLPSSAPPKVLRGRSPPGVFLDGANGIRVPKHAHTMPLNSTSSLEVPLRRVTPHMTGDSLANAIVASSLASSRLPSPSKSPLPLSAGQLGERAHLPFRHFREQTKDSRTPSPSKQSSYTMRKQRTGDETITLNHKRHKKFFRKHPHKHHEGDRKRWRNKITEAERKRYEGLWAANKGLFVEAPLATPGVTGNHERNEQDGVVNLVVKSIWERSCLPSHVLAEVWELVDRTSTGRLDREEFVVGLWLIDQRLKGHKLPIRVSPSVWASVHGVQGIKIPKPRA